MTTKEIMLACRASLFDWNEAEDTKNQKIFPFYIFTNFHVHQPDENNPGYWLDVDKLCCDYCGDIIAEPNNGSYYTSYVVFESAGIFKALCSVRRCKNKPGNLLTFHQQKYGFRFPVEFPASLEGSLEHETLFWWFFDKSHSNAYWLRQFPQGIKMRNYEEKLKCAYTGASYICNVKGEEVKGFRIEQTVYGIKILRDDRTVVTKLSPVRIVEIINEIISASNNKQLSLF